MGQTVIAAPVVQTGQYYPYDPVKNPLGQKTWTQYFNTSAPNNSAYYGYTLGSTVQTSIVYGNGIYAFVDYYGQLFYSTDAKNWNIQQIGVAYTGNALAYGNGIWVLGTNVNVILSGTPGGTWTARTSGFAGTPQISDIKYIAGLSLFIAVNYNPSSGTAIVSSSNGTTWTARYTDPGGFGNYYAIGVDNSTNTILVTTGSNNGIYSTNGTSWATTTITNQGSSSNAQYLNGLNRWITAAYYGTVYTSTSANIATNWGTQAATIYWNNDTAPSQAGNNISNKMYNYWYDSVNNYYYAITAGANQGTSYAPPTLITYSATQMVTSYNSATNYYITMPRVKLEYIPIADFNNATNYNSLQYAYLNGIHIYVNQSNRQLQIYTTA